MSEIWDEFKDYYMEEDSFEKNMIELDRENERLKAELEKAQKDVKRLDKLRVWLKEQEELANRPRVKTDYYLDGWEEACGRMLELLKEEPHE